MCTQIKATSYQQVLNPLTSKKDRILKSHDIDKQQIPLKGTVEEVHLNDHFISFCAKTLVRTNHYDMKVLLIRGFL